MAVSLVKSLQRSLIGFQGASHLRLTTLSPTPLTTTREFSSTPTANAARTSAERNRMRRDYNLEFHKNAADFIMDVVRKNGSITKDELKELALNKENDDMLGSVKRARLLLNALRSSGQLRVQRSNKQNPSKWVLPFENGPMETNNKHTHNDREENN